MDEDKLIEAVYQTASALNAAVENLIKNTSLDLSLSITTLPRRASIGLKEPRTIEQVTYQITRPIASLEVR